MIKFFKSLFKKKKPRPQPPRLINPGTPTPMGYFINPINMAFIWSPSEGSTQYRIIVKEQQTGNLVHTKLLSNESSTYLIPNGIIQYNKAYIWWMTGLINSTESILSSPLYFQTIFSAPNPPSGSGSF